MTDNRVYVAASLDCVTIARGFARVLASAGISVCSTWHEAVEPGDQDPTDAPSREQILTTNLGELLRSDVVVVLASQGRPRATYAEAGFALALCKPAIWLLGPNGEGNCIFSAHALSRIVTDEEAALAAVVASAKAVAS